MNLVFIKKAYPEWDIELDYEVVARMTFNDHIIRVRMKDDTLYVMSNPVLSDLQFHMEQITKRIAHQLLSEMTFRVEDS